MVTQKVCREPGCPVLVDKRVGACDVHARQPWLGNRKGEGASVSGWKWQRLRREVLLRDEWRCYLCGGEATEVDHVIPVAEGGSDDLDNLRAICRDCHRRKSAQEGARGLVRRRGG